jgi:hypothetical protein
MRKRQQVLKSLSHCNLVEIDLLRVGTDGDARVSVSIPLPNPSQPGSHPSDRKPLWIWVARDDLLSHLALEAGSMGTRSSICKRF